MMNIHKPFQKSGIANVLYSHDRSLEGTYVFPTDATLNVPNASGLRYWGSLIMLAKNEQSTVCTQQALTTVAKVYEAGRVEAAS